MKIEKFKNEIFVLLNRKLLVWNMTLQTQKFLHTTFSD